MHGHVWGAVVVPWADVVQYILNMSCKCSNITKSPTIVRVRVARVRVRVRVGGLGLGVGLGLRVGLGLGLLWWCQWLPWCNIYQICRANALKLHNHSLLEVPLSRNSPFPIGCATDCCKYDIHLSITVTL